MKNTVCTGSENKGKPQSSLHHFQHKLTCFSFLQFARKPQLQRKNLHINSIFTSCFCLIPLLGLWKQFIYHWQTMPQRNVSFRSNSVQSVPSLVTWSFKGKRVFRFSIQLSLFASATKSFLWTLAKNVTLIMKTLNVKSCFFFLSRNSAWLAI